jgi:hypothetical protein
VFHKTHFGPEDQGKQFFDDIKKANQKFIADGIREQVLVNLKNKKLSKELNLMRE